MNFGHCGIDWLHSLLDSHPQILIMPALSFYRSWKIIGCDNIRDAKKMFTLWKNRIKELLKTKKDSKVLFYSEAEADKFYSRFEELLESKELTCVNVFWALHEAYAFAKDINLSQIRVVVAQEHFPHYFQHILTDFPNSNIIQIIRDPRATFAGSWRENSKKYNYLTETNFSHAVVIWLHAYENWKKYKHKLGNRYKVVRNEDLHASLESKMWEIANWMGIEFSPVLLKETFSGRPWEGESTYMTSDNRYPDSEEIFFLPENIKKRWMKELSHSEIVMIEFLTRKSMEEFGYNPMTRGNLIWKIYGFILYLLPRRGLLREQIRSYLKFKKHKFNPKREGVIFTNKWMSFLWNYSPRPIKVLLVVLHSPIERILNYFFPIKRAKKYT